MSNGLYYEEEFETLLQICNIKTALGCRDELMLLLLYNTGVRVSELIGLYGRDIIWGANSSNAYIHVSGKGRKERTVPLWKSTAKRLALYIKVHKIGTDNKLFINYTGRELTRSGIRYRLKCLVDEAIKSMPNLGLKTIFSTYISPFYSIKFATIGCRHFHNCYLAWP